MSRGIKPEYKAMYFTQDGRVWKLAEKIKNAVTFHQFNLQNSFTSLGEFNLIFCRYVMIYFAEKLKREVFAKIARILVNDGVLIIGNSELFFDYKDDYEMMHCKTNTYFKVKR
jgi:chemotaxis protein methyltransferase CheR